MFLHQSSLHKERSPMSKTTLPTPASILNELPVSPGAQALIDSSMSQLKDACATRQFFIKVPLEYVALREGTEKNQDLQEACVRLALSFSVTILGDWDSGGYLVVGLPGYHDFK
jgi:hypothetical protein